MPHLLVDITAHGYGHVAQTAPVVNELAHRIPGLHVTVRSAAPLQFLRQRFACEFQHVPATLDFGMKMANAVDVQEEESAAAYRALHEGWEGIVSRAADDMRMLQPDLLLANIPYLSLAAASAAGIPAVGMCCLNWADIYWHYCAADAASQAIYAQMLAAYNSAPMFLKVQPTMPMPDLVNARSIAPIARIGNNSRAAIIARLPQGAEEKLVMVAMGGMEFRLPVENWPRSPGIRWLIPQAWGVERDDMTSFESLGLPFSDALASCDAVLTKPGYGTFAESACAGVPVLYVSRRDWPEEPYLVQWLQQNCACLEVERERLQQGRLQDLLIQLWEMQQPPRPHPDGAVEAAQIIMDNYF